LVGLLAEVSTTCMPLQYVDETGVVELTYSPSSSSYAANFYSVSDIIFNPNRDMTTVTGCNMVM
jgi:hypothetical protein